MRWLALALLLCSACGYSPTQAYCERLEECGEVADAAECAHNLQQYVLRQPPECQHLVLDLYACMAGLECGAAEEPCAEAQQELLICKQ